MTKEEQLDFIQKIREAHTDEGRLMMTDKLIERIKEEEYQYKPPSGKFTWLPVSHEERRKVYHQTILYAESQSQYCDVHLIHSRIPFMEISHNLHWLEKELNDEEFIRISEHHLIYCPNVCAMHPLMKNLKLLPDKILTIDHKFKPPPIPLLKKKLRFHCAAK